MAKKEEKEKEEGEVRKKNLVEKVQRKDGKSLYGRKEEKKRKAERKRDVPDRDKSWGSLEDGSFSFCCVSML